MAEAAGAPRRMPLAWRHPGFRRLTVVWLFTNLADSALALFVAVWIKELTGSDAAAALVFAMLSLPAFLAPFLGHVADRVSRKWLLVGSNLGIAAVTATLLLVDSPSWVWFVYAVMFVYSSVGYLTAAAQAGLLRDLLPDEHLASGNGMLSTIDQSLRLVAPLVGTGAYALFGPTVVIVATMTAFVIAALLLAGLKITESAIPDAASRGGYWTEVTAGFRHLGATPLLGRLTIIVAIAFGATGLVNVTAFPVIEQGLGLGAAAIGPLITVQGIGSVIAGATAATLIGLWGEVRVLGLGLAVMGLGVVPLLTGSLPAIVVGLVAVGGGVTWTVVAYVTLRQRLTPARLQGRTSAATNVAVNLPQTVVMFVGAGLLAIVDYRVLLLVTAVGVLSAAAMTPLRRAAVVAPDASADASGSDAA